DDEARRAEEARQPALELRAPKPECREPRGEERAVRAEEREREPDPRKDVESIGGRVGPPGVEEERERAVRRRAEPDVARERPRSEREHERREREREGRGTADSGAQHGADAESAREPGAGGIQEDGRDRDVALQLDERGDRDNPQ